MRDTVRIIPLFLGGLAAVTFGVTLRFICCVKSALLASTAPTYNLLKAANLDQDERGSDGEDVTRGPSLPFFLISWLLSATRGEEPSSLLQTPITRHISVRLLDASSWTLSYPLLYKPQTSASFISTPQTPPGSAPRMIKNKSDNLDVLSPLFSLAVLFVAGWRKNWHKVRSNRSQIFVLC